MNVADLNGTLWWEVPADDHSGLEDAISRLSSSSRVVLDVFTAQNLGCVLAVVVREDLRRRVQNKNLAGHFSMFPNIKAAITAVESGEVPPVVKLPESDDPGIAEVRAQFARFFGSGH